MKVFCLDGPYKNEVLSDVPDECRRTKYFLTVGDQQVSYNDFIKLTVGNQPVNYNDFIKPTLYYLHTVVDSSKTHYMASVQFIISSESIIERLMEAIEYHQQSPPIRSPRVE